MIDLERVICFTFFNDDIDQLSEIRERVVSYQKKGFPDDVIYQFFEEDASSPIHPDESFSHELFLGGSL